MLLFFTTYASSKYATSILFLHPLVTLMLCAKTAEWIERVFGKQASLGQCHALCYNGFIYLEK